MKIELKKIQFSERMSEETNCFVADLYINGIKVGECKNNGQGGCTDYRGDTLADTQLIREAENYFKSLPKVKPEGYDFLIQPTLEDAIDEELEKYLKAKFKAKQEKKMSKLFQNAIVIGIPNDTKYRYMKFSVPLSNIPMTKLVFYVTKLISEECHSGVKILNTNFKFENGQVIFI